MNETNNSKLGSFSSLTILPGGNNWDMIVFYHENIGCRLIGFWNIVIFSSWPFTSYRLPVYFTNQILRVLSFYGEKQCYLWMNCMHVDETDKRWFLKLHNVLSSCNYKLVGKELLFKLFFGLCNRGRCEWDVRKAPNS